MKRILVIPSWYPPDGGQFFQDQAEALEERGFRVDLLVNRMVGLTKLRFSERSTLRRFSVSFVNNTRVVRSFYLKVPRLELWNVKRGSISTRRLFRKYVKRFGLPDLIIAHSSMWAGYFAAQIWDRWKIPYLVVEHRSRFTLSESEQGELLQQRYTPFLRRAFMGAERVITVSEALQPSVLNYMDDEEKLMVISNQVDTSFFTPGTFIPGREEPEEFRILSVGRLERDKGMDLLIEAFSKLAGDDNHLSLTIVGSGPELKSLRSQVAELGLNGRVTFTGKKSPAELLKEMQRASLFALASRMEAFGVVFVEAMAVGLPIVATRAGGPEKIIPGFAGEMVEKEDVTALSHAIRKVCREIERYDAEQIRTYAIENFSREVISRRYAALIAQLFDD
ncbi:MAG: glycosyltransferase [Bacteroidota bacterium]